MKTPRTKLSNAIADRTLKSGVSKKLGKEVAAYLLSERRVHELGSVLRDVQADWAAAGHVEVKATTAHSLSAGLKADIRRQIKKLYPSARRIIVTEVHDPTLIGGIRLSLPNRQLDLSVESKLNRFKQSTQAGKE